MTSDRKFDRWFGFCLGAIVGAGTIAVAIYVGRVPRDNKPVSVESWECTAWVVRQVPDENRIQQWKYNTGQDRSFSYEEKTCTQLNRR